MTINPINIGSAPNDGTGQDLRSGGQIINDNFAELDTRTAAAQAKADQGVSDAATAKSAADAARAKADSAVPGSALGVSVAQLVNGTVPAGQLPSFVDDVLEYPTLADFPATGETGKIYIAINGGDSPTNPTRQYRWGGTAFVLIPASPGSTDQVPEGSSNLYFTLARVRSTLLAGLGAAVNSSILASDTLLQALAKLQGQINAKLGLSEMAADSAKLNGQPASFYTASMTGATSSAAGSKGLVPAPGQLAANPKFLSDDGTWKEPVANGWVDGEFSPGFSLVTTGGVVTPLAAAMFTAFGTYTRIGSRVFVELVVRLGSTKPTGNTTDSLRITGLPFASKLFSAAPATDLSYTVAFQVNNAASTSGTFTTASVPPGVSYVSCQKFSSGAVTNMTLADINASAVFRMSLVYVAGSST